ncbi:MAG: hypothetical protein PHQ17_03075 [Methanobacterium sp.]|nr:hypothetical protein [Methanobacterium sp.]
MNENEYLAEVKGLNQEWQQIIDATKNSIETGSEETRSIHKKEYKTKMQIIYSNFSSLIPPRGFETSHQLYLESINYSIAGEKNKAADTYQRAHNETMKTAGRR